MKIIILNLILVLSIINCSVGAAQSANKAALNEYKDHLSTVNEFVTLYHKKNEFNYDVDRLNNSIVFLEELTNIYCDIVNSFENDFEPSKENYEDWKMWYRLNKENIYLEGNKVIVNGIIQPLEKDPVKYYKKKLKYIKKSLNRKILKDPDYSSAMSFLMNLTKTKEISFDKESNVYIPSDENIIFFENWLKENEKRLFWDEKEQKVKLKKSDESN